MPPPSEIAQRVVENPVVTAIGRIAQFLTLPVVTVILWVGGNYLAGQTSALAGVGVRLATVEQFDSSVGTRVTALETQAQLGRADRIAFQNQTESTLEKIIAQDAQMLASEAAIAARLDEADRQATRH